MKTIVIIISFVLIGSPVFSQTEVMIEQIIKLKTYLSWLKKGYDIANKGLTLIGDIKHGDFNLHKDYFNSLEQVNPQIKGDVKIAAMISMQVQMLSSYKSYYQQFKASGVFTGKELNYLYQVFTVLLDDVARDITELKRSNNLIRKREAMLQEAQKLSHIGSWEWDIAHDVVTWTDELYRIFGYEPDEITITYETYLDKIHPGDKEFVNNIIQKAFKDHKPFNFYHRVLRDGGTEVTLYAHGEVSVDKHNNVVRMNGTAQDVTELKRKEEMLERQNEELQKINAELDKFVYSVSHDLRAPLTSMLGIIEISIEESQSQNMQERLNLLKTNITKLDQFILDILDHSRNARMEIRNEEINFHELVNDITANLKYGSGISDHKVDVRVNIKSDGYFYSDKNRMTIILNNLISNAIRYANPDTKNPFVGIDVMVNEREANIVIEDNGIGIDKAFHDKIFEMFYRVSHNSIGSGLGLYLVKESLKKLNGTIKVESEKGKGTVFYISIPQ